MRFRRPNPAVEQCVAFPAAESPARPAPPPGVHASGAGHPTYAPEPVPQAASWGAECYPQWVGRSDAKPFISTDAAFAEIAALRVENASLKLAAKELLGKLAYALEQRDTARAERDNARAAAGGMAP